MKIALSILSCAILLCPNIAFAELPKSMCINKVFITGTVEGVYKGNECGDFCYSAITLDNGEEFSFMCGEDEAEKFLGKPGNRVSVTYEFVQFWNEEPSVCFQTEVFKSAKVLSANTKQGGNQPKMQAPNPLVGTYAIKEKGYSGGLQVLASPADGNALSINVETVKNSNASTCDFSAACTVTNGKLVCKDAGNILEASISQNALDIIKSPDVCGRGATIDGKYVKK